MISNRIAFVAVGVACVAAAGAGSYFATRQSQSSAMAATASPASAPLSAPENGAAAAASQATLPTQTTPQAPPQAAMPLQAPAHTATPAATNQKNKNAPVTTMARNAAPVSDTRSVAAPPQSAAAPLAAQEPLAVLPPPAPDTSSHQDDVRLPEPARAIEPERAPEKMFDELVVSSGSVIGVQLETALSSEHAKVEDQVNARVVRDVRVGSHVAIPAGAHVTGSVMVVEQGGKFKDRARLGIRFNTLVLSDGTKVPITTETIFRYGDPPSNGSAAKIGGGAVIGTILGGIIGGGKGAAIGAAAGAGGGAVATANGDASHAEFPAGMQLTARFVAPVAITVER